MGCYYYVFELGQVYGISIWIYFWIYCDLYRIYGENT